jgi:hypothetical protein
MGGLLQDEEDLGQRRSHGSYGNEDDAPLSGPGRRGVRRHREDEGRLFNLGSRIRLPSFMSTTSHLDEVPNDPPEPDSGEIDPGASRTILVGQLQKSHERFISSFLSSSTCTSYLSRCRRLYPFCGLVTCRHTLSPWRLSYPFH